MLINKIYYGNNLLKIGGNSIEKGNFKFVQGEVDSSNLRHKETIIFLIDIVNRLNQTDEVEELRIATLDPIKYASSYVYELTALIKIEIFIDDFSHEKLYITENISRENFVKIINNIVDERKKKFINW